MFVSYIPHCGKLFCKNEFFFSFLAALSIVLQRITVFFWMTIPVVTVPSHNCVFDGPKWCRPSMCTWSPMIIALSNFGFVCTLDSGWTHYSSIQGVCSCGWGRFARERGVCAQLRLGPCDKIILALSINLARTQNSVSIWRSSFRFSTIIDSSAARTELSSS